MTDHDDFEFDRMARAAGAALRRAAPEDGVQRVRAIRKRRQTVRAAMVGVAGVAILVAGVLVAKGDHDTVGNTPATSPTTTVAPVVVHTPLALTTPPTGFALQGQSVRPTSGEATRGAVFVRRDAAGNVTERMTAYLQDDIYRGAPGFAIPVPANLAPAEGSSLQFFTPNRMVRIEYGLKERGYLVMEAYHDDLKTSGTLADEMQAIAASLGIGTDHSVSVAGALPDGWSLATAGPPPFVLAQSWYQAYEVDKPDGGNKVMVENSFLDDPGFPYWGPYQGLQPVTVRAHAGFVTVVNEFGSDGTTAEPTNTSSLLIWEEEPGHWVTLWAGGMTTDQALALADQLVPVPSSAWGPDGIAVPTTTTTFPTPTT